MSDSGGSGQGQGQGQNTGSYQNGVWLSKSEGARNEKYQKWTDDRNKFQVRSLDKQRHSSLVKLNGECLQVRTELRGLQKDRRQFHPRPRHTSTGSVPGAGSESPGSDAVQSPAGARALRKTSSSSTLMSSSSSSSLTSMSSGGYSSPRRIHNGEVTVEGVKVKAAGRGGKGALNPEESALKLKKLHSSRALSKLNNNMDV